MAHQGAYEIVPDKLTGANTTNGQFYVGATKAGTGGAGYVLGYFPASVPAGAGVGRTVHTDYTALLPWVFTTVAGGYGAATGGIVGVCDESHAASGFGWVQTAGKVSCSVSCQSASLAALAGLIQTDTAGIWYETAASTNNIGGGDVVMARFNASASKAANTGSTTCNIFLIPA